MQLGAFMMPAHPPSRSLADGHYHDLDTIEFLDRIGFREVWIGEHYNLPAEPNPSPDIMIAQAIMRTKQIVLAPGAFMLPFHHPAELAHRICLLDHLSKGRFMVGIGASGTTLDLEMFDIDHKAGVNRDMTDESVDIMVKFWESDGPFEYRGRFWTVRRPADDPNGTAAYHIKPYQKPYPPIGVTGLSARSPTLKLAGARGWIPISFCFTPQYLRTHWESICEGAEKAGRAPPSRDTWRVSRNIFVAQTEKDAWNLTVNGEMGRYYRENYLPLAAAGGMLSSLKHDPSVPDSDVTVEYCAKHSWLIGTPDSVSEKLEEMQHLSGGFGVLHSLGIDHLDEMSTWRASLSALATEVAPRFAN